MIFDFDATPMSAHSNKEGAAGHYRGGFGFNPLLVSCGREVLAAILRPGNAGASHALAEGCRETGVRFSFGYAMDARVRRAVSALPERVSRPLASRATGHAGGDCSFQATLSGKCPGALRRWKSPMSQPPQRSA